MDPGDSQWGQQTGRTDQQIHRAAGRASTSAVWDAWKRQSRFRRPFDKILIKPLYEAKPATLVARR